ncbi:MAG: TetR/AcrR family transcriptional regulator [Paracoccaceae bacterium]
MDGTVPKESPPAAQGRILDAAENIFAEQGFAGAGMKAIALRANVAQGLLHYHFSNKDGLYAAVIERRSGIINRDRISLLDQVNLEKQDPVPDIMEALLKPPLGPAGGGRAYARILAGLCVGDARDSALVEEHYDPTAKRFIAALQIARPHASARSISWGYNLAVGALIATVARDGRSDRLIGAVEKIEDLEKTVARTVAYAAGGLDAIIAADAPP